jgi:Flp pilus assembly secretin CpaC
VNFLDTGINLNFRPFITTDGMIRMELEPKVSEASLRTVTDANGQSVTIPDEFTNQLTTNVRVKDGQTLILGGLFKEDTSITRRQVPLLGDIPVVGAAFRGQDDTVRRDEIIFLITPTILQDQALWAAGKDAMGMVEPTRVGARAGLLFFGQTAMTDKYNQNAIDAYNSGNTERALYYANNSLRLAPDQPQMIAFREVLTGEKAQVVERSLMENTFRRQLGGIATGINPPQPGDKKASMMIPTPLPQP